MPQDVEKLVNLVEEAAEEKKANDITILDVGKVSVVADYFVIASGGSRTQVYAIADNIMEKMKEAGYDLLHREGYNEGVWVLLDYGDIVVHIFQPEERSFYNLERLWSHAPRAGNNSPDNNVDNEL
ncbi:ribosome silencing factor [Dethiobacter alkaliphilus]|uniref:Ribosomal silencing factor RsfS n=1 Tax=Dethiobacter alkaliphilus AHT 1 TaxID=555088 RepID=C0GEU2_DETAL|nr:ribosome silencing factor [Dethiobacter alkaliphilus]EEG78124.1 iojap-like protein [Dethiobacter alkaliphilus AHT 1]